MRCYLNLKGKKDKAVIFLAMCVFMFLCEMRYWRKAYFVLKTKNSSLKIIMTVKQEAYCVIHTSQGHVHIAVWKQAMLCLQLTELLQWEVEVVVVGLTMASDGIIWKFFLVPNKICLLFRKAFMPLFKM